MNACIAQSKKERRLTTGNIYRMSNLMENDKCASVIVDLSCNESMTWNDLPGHSYVMKFSKEDLHLDSSLKDEPKGFKNLYQLITSSSMNSISIVWQLPLSRSLASVKKCEYALIQSQVKALLHILPLVNKFGVIIDIYALSRSPYWHSMGMTHTLINSAKLRCAELPTCRLTCRPVFLGVLHVNGRSSQMRDKSFLN